MPSTECSALFVFLRQHRKLLKKRRFSALGNPRAYSSSAFRSRAEDSCAEADWVVLKCKDSEVKPSGDLVPLLTNYVNEGKSPNIFVPQFLLL